MDVWVIRIYLLSFYFINYGGYTNKSNYDMTSSYELNGGVQKFKVLDYEVFKI